MGDTGLKDKIIFIQVLKKYYEKANNVWRINASSGLDLEVPQETGNLLSYIIICHEKHCFTELSRSKVYPQRLILKSVGSNFFT